MKMATANKAMKQILSKEDVNLFLKSIKELVKEGADVDSGPNDGTILSKGARYDTGNLPACQWLMIRQGANSNKFGFFPLHTASDKNHAKVVQFLIAEGAPVNHRDEMLGCTALNLASHAGNLNVVKALIRDGNAFVNSVTKDGETPLWHASYNGHFEIVEFLLENGADAFIRDKNGYTPLMIAEREKQGQVADLLRQHVETRRAWMDHQLKELLQQQEKQTRNEMKLLSSLVAHDWSKQTVWSIFIVLGLSLLYFYRRWAKNQAVKLASQDHRQDYRHSCTTINDEEESLPSRIRNNQEDVGNEFYDILLSGIYSKDELVLVIEYAGKKIHSFSRAKNLDQWMDYFKMLVEDLTSLKEMKDEIETLKQNANMGEVFRDEELDALYCQYEKALLAFEQRRIALDTL